MELRYKSQVTLFPIELAEFIEEQASKNEMSIEAWVLMALDSMREAAKTSRKGRSKLPRVLKLPYDTIPFIQTWERLLQQPKWRKKTQGALESALCLLAKYPVEVSIEMMEKSIRGEYQGLFRLTEAEMRNFKPKHEDYLGKLKKDTIREFILGT